MDKMFTENWADTKAALLEGLTPQKQKIVAPLLENQKDHILREDAAAGATAAHDVAGFRKILIPMIRRIIPGTIATELVGVQPMQGPVGLVYSLRYSYADSVAHDSTNSPFGGYDITAGDEAFGNASPIRAFYSGQAGSAGQAAGAGGIDGAIARTDVGSDTAATSLDDTFARSDIDDGSGTPATGEAWPSSLDKSATTGDISRGGSGSFMEGSGGRRMKLEIISQAVEAGSRKLQAGWTIEAMQDMNSQHGLDLESEMTQALSAEITQEIDAEVITDLLSLAGTTVVYDHTGGANNASSGITPAYLGDRYANLGVSINYVANEIGRKTRRGVGNFVVVSPMIVSALQSASKSVFAPAVDGSFKGPNNTMLVGKLNGSINVYSYLWNQAQPGADAFPGTGGGTDTDQILVGYKGGNGELDTGYFYCPYIPLMSSGVVVNPVTFQPVVSLMTRYGKTSFTSTTTSLGNSADYYGKITVANLAFA
jgi:hypothetical protein